MVSDGTSVYVDLRYVHPGMEAYIGKVGSGYRATIDLNGEPLAVGDLEQTRLLALTDALCKAVGYREKWDTAICSNRKDA